MYWPNWHTFSCQQVFFIIEQSFVLTNLSKDIKPINSPCWKINHDSAETFPTQTSIYNMSAHCMHYEDLLWITFPQKIKFPSVKISSSLLCKNAPTNVFKILQKRIKKVNFIKFQNIQFLIRPCGLTMDCVSLKIDWRKKEIGHSSVNCSSLQKCPNIFFYIHGQSPVLPNLLLL